ncbi:MAG: hypothetical protein M3Q73_01600 [bacterium]|nr:hypothetical protein [bacterium]
MRTKTHTLKVKFWDNLNTKLLFFVLAGLLLMIFVSYAYLINKTIMNVVAREKSEQRIATLSSVIGELEFEHMMVKNKVTLELAHQKGFMDASPSRFLARSGALLLTYNSDNNSQ